MKIKAILFDLGDIFFEAHLWRGWLFKKLQKMKLFHGDFKEFYNLYDSHLMRYAYLKKANYNEVFVVFLKKLKMPEEKINFFSKKALKQKVFFEKKRRLYPNVKDTLEKIKLSGIKNAIVTDNESSETEIRIKIINRYKINNLIDLIVTSKDSGYVKPNPKIFQFTLKALDLSPNTALFVGHDADEIKGAKKCKLKTVEFNNYLGIETRADFKIKKINELLMLTAD